MTTLRRPLIWAFLVTALAGLVSMSGQSGVALAQVFSVEPASPLAAAPGGSPANLYRPGPTLYAPAGAIGLLPGDDVDALSFGFDDVAFGSIHFSTGFFTAGAAVSGNAVCSEAGTCAPPVPCPPEAAADIFSTSGLGSAALLFDGDGAPGAAPPLGLRECPAGGPGTQDNVDAFDDLVAPLVDGRPAWRLYFSLAPGSPTLGGVNPLLPGGARAGDILVYDPRQDSLSIYFAAGQLGLASADDVDGLSFNVFTGDLVFSLAPGSPSLAAPAGICPGGCTAGDFIRSAGLICGPTPCLAGGLGFASAGMAAGDNVDAMDHSGSPPPFAFDETSPGRTYSVDPPSPVLKAIRARQPSRPGSPADLLTQDSMNPTGAPRIVYGAESLGLLPDDDIDGLSFGSEPVFVPGRDYAPEFSVDRAATGAPGTGVFAQATSAMGAEASTDVFDSFMPAAAVPAATNRQAWDGDGSSAPALQLREVHLAGPAGTDDLDALEGPPQLVDRDQDGVRDLPIYFSLAPGSPTLSGANPLLPGGAFPGDILVSPAPFAAPSVFVSVAALGIGLGTADNLEDFSLDAASGNVDFTLPPGPAAALGGEPGTIFKRAGFAPCVGPNACAIFSALAVGLLGTDNMNALDALAPARVCVTIASGSDPNIMVTYGGCATPISAGPYDVIEGELGEFTEHPGNVDVSRVFCRADSWLFDRITLGGGLDPFTRGQFILVRNDGAPGYGVSTEGNPRTPSSGDCP